MSHRTGSNAFGKYLRDHRVAVDMTLRSTAKALEFFRLVKAQYFSQEEMRRLRAILLGGEVNNE